MTSTTTNRSLLDAESAEAEQDYDAAQARWRSRPQGTPMLRGANARIQIDPVGRAQMLELGLDVDRAFIRVESLKRQKAELRLAEVANPEEMAAEDAAVEAAQRDMVDAEAKAAAARIAYQAARGVQKQRAESIKTQHAEMARASAAIQSAEKLREKEQAQRDELAPVISPDRGLVAARAR